MKDAASLEKIYRDSLKARMAELESVHSISEELAEELIEEARQRGNDVRIIRQIRDLYSGLISSIRGRGPEQLDDEIHDMCVKTIQNLESLADYTEDFSEALALSAHGPFRDLVISELKEVGIK